MCYSNILAIITVFCSLVVLHLLENEAASDSSSPKLTIKTCINLDSIDDVVSNIIGDLYSSIRDSECDLANPADYPSPYSPRQGEEFEFIIVGAGSSGSVIANRLSEITSWSILLVEAGGDVTKTTEVPDMFLSCQQTHIDWQFKTSGDEDCCLGLKDNRCLWPRGKVLGGSSAINAMLYVRGSPEDYNNWARNGNTGWDYETVLEYFKKSENIIAEEVRAKENFRKYHGEGGYLSVDSWRHECDAVDGLVDAYTLGMGAMGYQFNDDINGDSQLGFVRFQGNTLNGRRHSAGIAFLKTAKDRKNLKVSKNSLVTRITIDSVSKVAQGIEIINEKGETVKVFAKKEVIVSAGTISTPKLLMLSGIGPKEHLEELGIEVIKDSPVGKNLTDNALYSGIVFSYNFTRINVTMSQSIYDFLLTNRSKLSEFGMLGYGLFLNIEDSTINYPDVQAHLFENEVGDTTKLQTILTKFGIRDEIAKLYHEINRERYINMVMPVVLRPKSRGRILLSSTNPNDDPKIVSGYLTEEEDVEKYLKTIEFLENLTMTEGMKKVDTKFHLIEVPACAAHPTSSREFRVCSLKHLVTTLYHPTSTCRMGGEEDVDSVVDPSLRVKGIDRLRVADGSVMYEIVSGNPNAAAYMIGEKVSDMIKAQWMQ